MTNMLGQLSRIFSMFCFQSITNLSINEGFAWNLIRFSLFMSHQVFETSQREFHHVKAEQNGVLDIFVEHHQVNFVLGAVDVDLERSFLFICMHY